MITEEVANKLLQITGDNDTRFHFVDKQDYDHPSDWARKSLGVKNNRYAVDWDYEPDSVFGPPVVFDNRNDDKVNAALNDPKITDEELANILRANPSLHVLIDKDKGVEPHINKFIPIPGMTGAQKFLVAAPSILGLLGAVGLGAYGVSNDNKVAVLSSIAPALLGLAGSGVAYSKLKDQPLKALVYQARQELKKEEKAKQPKKPRSKKIKAKSLSELPEDVLFDLYVALQNNMVYYGD